MENYNLDKTFDVSKARERLNRRWEMERHRRIRTLFKDVLIVCDSMTWFVDLVCYSRSSRFPRSLIAMPH